MRRLGVITGALSVAVAFLAVGIGAAGAASPPAHEPSAASAQRLRSFATCDQFLGYTKRHARRVVGPWGFAANDPRVIVEPAPAPVEEAAPDTSRGVPGVDFSTTNVQETGVDEPDLVKSDGSHIFAVAQGKLHSVDPRGARSRLLGSLPLEEGSNHQLLLHGDRLLVISSGGGPIVPLPLQETIVPFRSTTLLTEVDVSDPRAMRVVRTLKVDGLFLNARLIGRTARVVLTSAPTLEFPTPARSEPGWSERATKRNRAVIGKSRLRNWIPSYVLENRRTGRKKKRLAVGCKGISRPPEFSGLGMLTVLTFDLKKGLKPVDSDAIMTGGNIVYASQTGLYVATRRWLDPRIDSRPSVVPTGITTRLHKFDISEPLATKYRASGEVPGFLLNQWSLSEHEGWLRVASTVTPPWWAVAPQQESESFVTVLGEQAGKLVQVGRVGKLGLGERIFGVRFMGDVGYVVTFRQIDPLYTLDLANPRRPEVLGELKITGFSAYLHPLDGNTIMGLGRAADATGRISGTQLSVFDVSNLRKPARLHRRTIDRAWSEAEYDHHAFLYWPATSLAVFSVRASLLEPTKKHRSFVGAIAYRVDRKGIKRLATLMHPTASVPGTRPDIYPPEAPIRRALVVGKTLYTVSEQGVKASTLKTLADRAWVPFG